MKKIFTFLMMAVCAIAVVSVTSCKDYDDDLNNDFRSQFSKNENLLQVLQGQIGGLEQRIIFLEEHGCSCTIKTVADLQNYLNSHNYKTQSEIEKLIADALSNAFFGQNTQVGPGGNPSTGTGSVLDQAITNYFNKYYGTSGEDVDINDIIAAWMADKNNIDIANIIKMYLLANPIPGDGTGYTEDEINKMIEEYLKQHPQGGDGTGYDKETILGFIAEYLKDHPQGDGTGYDKETILGFIAEYLEKNPPQGGGSGLDKAAVITIIANYLSENGYKPAEACPWTTEKLEELIGKYLSDHGYQTGGGSGNGVTMDEVVAKFNELIAGYVKSSDFNSLVANYLTTIGLTTQTINDLKKLLEDSKNFVTLNQMNDSISKVVEKIYTVDTTLAKAIGRLEVVEKLSTANRKTIDSLISVINEFKGTVVLKSDLQTTRDSLSALYESVKANTDWIAFFKGQYSKDSTAVWQKLNAYQDSLNALHDSISNALTSAKNYTDAEIATAIATLRGGYTGSMQDLYNLIKENQDSIAKINGYITDINGNITTINGDIVKINTSITELTNNITNLNDTLTAMKLTLGNLVDRMATVENDVDDLKQKVQTLRTDVDQLSNRVKSVEEQVESLVDRVNNVVDRLNSQISGIIVQSVTTPLFLDANLALPVNVQSNVLCAYYGEVKNGKTWFPSSSKSFNLSEDDEILTDAEVMGVEGFNMAGLPQGTELKSTGGKVYLTINPNTVNFTGAGLRLTDSQNGESGFALTNVKKSDKKLYFMGRAANNGFYEADAELIDAGRAGFQTAPLKDAAKEVYHLLKNRTGVRDMATAVVKAAYKSVHLPAYAVQAPYKYTDENGNEVTAYVHSNYNIAATAVHPLSYNLTGKLGDYTSKISHRTLRHIPYLSEKIIDMSSWGDIKGKLYFEFDDVDYQPKDFSFTIPNLSLDDVNLTATATGVTFTYEQPTGYDPLTNQFTGWETKTGTIDAITVPINGSELQAIEQAIQKQILDNLMNQFNKLSADMTKLQIEFVDAFNLALENTADMINKRAEEVLEIIESMMHKTDTYVDRVNNLIDRINNQLNKVYDRLDNVDHYILPIMFYGNSKGDLHRMSSYMNSASYVTAGHMVLYPTSYTAEILNPAAKKVVQVTKAVKLSTGKNDAAEVAAANASYDNLNKVVDGSVRAIGVELKAGYAYEFAYSALDYTGYQVTQRYWVKVK